MLSNCGVWKVELWVAWLDPAAALLVSRNLSRQSTSDIGHLTLLHLGAFLPESTISCLVWTVGLHSLLSQRIKYTRADALQRLECLCYDKHGLSGACFSVLCRSSVLSFDDFI